MVDASTSKYIQHKKQENAIIESIKPKAKILTKGRPTILISLSPNQAGPHAVSASMIDVSMILNVNGAKKNSAQTDKLLALWRKLPGGGPTDPLAFLVKSLRFGKAKTKPVAVILETKSVSVRPSWCRTTVSPTAAPRNFRSSLLSGVIDSATKRSLSHQVRRKSREASRSRKVRRAFSSCTGRRSLEEMNKQLKTFTIRKC